MIPDDHGSGTDSLVHGPRTVRPDHADRQWIGGRLCREHPGRGIAGKESSARGDDLVLRDGSTEHLDAGTDGVGVRSPAPQPHEDAGSGRLVAEQCGGSILVVESLDRLSRDEILPAQNLLTTLLLKGITVVTLSDGRRVSF